MYFLNLSTKYPVPLSMNQNYTWERITSYLFNRQKNNLNLQQIYWIQEIYGSYLLNYVQLFSGERIQQVNTSLWYQTLVIFLFNNKYVKTELSVAIYSNYIETIYSKFLQSTNYNNDNNDNNIDDNSNVNESNNNINNDDNNEREDPFENNRDWLDNFYMLSRIIILLSIIYFYSTPIRFIIVTLLGFLIYVYHNRFFRINSGGIAENNNEHAENYNELVQNDNHLHRIQRQLRNQPENTNDPLIRTYRIQSNRENEPSILSYIWIILSSFFASLIPEQPRTM